MGEALCALVWLVCFKPGSKLPFSWTPFQAAKTFCEICEQQHQYLNYRAVSENLKEENSTRLTEFLTVKLVKLGDASEDADGIVSPV